MEKNSALVDDLVGQRVNGDFKLGEVIQSYSDNEDDWGVEQGHVYVEWYPDGLGEEVKETELEVLNRVLMPKDIVYKDQEQLGTVLEANTVADCDIVGTDKRLKNISVKKMNFISPVACGEIVAYGPWIGEALAVERILSLKCTSGERGCIPESLLNKSNCVEDPFPHKSDKRHQSGCGEYYPGQALLMSQKIINFINFDKTPSNKMKVKVLVEGIEMSALKVRWIQSSGVNAVGGDNSEVFKGIPLDEPPPSVIVSQNLRWIRNLSISNRDFNSLGARFWYILTEDDVKELNKPQKKRKRKLTRRRNQRTESVDRKHRRKSSGSSTVTKRRSHRLLMSKRDGDSSSDDSDDWKESKKASLSDSFSYSKSIRGILRDAEPKKSEKSASTSKSIDKKPKNLKVEIKAANDKVAASVESEDTMSPIEEDDAKSKSFLYESARVKIFGQKLYDKSFLVRIDIKKISSATISEIKKILPTKMLIKSSCIKKIPKYIKECQHESPFVLHFERPHSKHKFMKLSNRKWMMPHKRKINKTAFDIPYFKNITFQADPKVRYFAGQRVTIEIAMPRTNVTVQWQDSTIVSNISSTSLTPPDAINENDFFPGDFVVDTRESTKPLDMFKYGVVQKFFSKKRMAEVQWFTCKDLHHERLENEEVTTYDLKANPDYRFVISDTVFRLGPGLDPDNFRPTQTFGQVLRVTTEGKIRVKWLYDTITEVFPTEVLIYNDENANYSEHMSDTTYDSDMSWITLSTDEENEDRITDMDHMGYEVEIGKLEDTSSMMFADSNAEASTEDSKTEEAIEDDATVEDEDSSFLEVVKNNPGLAQFEILNSAPTSHKFYSCEQHVIDKPFMRARRRDIRLFSNSLPNGVFVRAYADRMDLMSALIAGPDNTPFRDGLFAFELFFPPHYPNVPPVVHFVSMGPRLNPNLYENGTVCVSLLGTWSGEGNENWTKESSILQVLLSIQGLILNKEPYFNEAGYEHQRGTPSGLTGSRYYNEMVVLRMVQHMTTFVEKTPQPFDNQDCRSIISDLMPRFIARCKVLLEASIDCDNLEKDLSDLSGFPLLTLSRGVIVGLQDKLKKLESVAKEKGFLANLNSH